jgi:hypothetical protein
MNYKNGVYVEVVVVRDGKRKRVKPSSKIKTAMNIADALSQAIAGKEIFITAILDGEHMEGSKHYDGDAFDIRILYGMYTKAQVQDLVQNLRDNLGKDYDVVLHKTHIHIEYDPK